MIDEYKKNFKTAYLAEEYVRLEKEESELDLLLSTDPSIADLVSEDKGRITTRKEELLTQMKQIVEKDKEEEEIPKVIIMEIAAGAGGDESALFALDLVTMYTAFAETKGWQTNIIDSALSDNGGYKDVSLEIKGKDAYEYLRYETGVHRVQRVPETEKNGRVHTSTVTVAITPVREKSVLVVPPSDIEMETSRSGGGFRARRARAVPGCRESCAPWPHWRSPGRAPRPPTDRAVGSARRTATPPPRRSARSFRGDCWRTREARPPGSARKAPPTPGPRSTTGPRPTRWQAYLHNPSRRAWRRRRS